MKKSLIAEAAEEDEKVTVVLPQFIAHEPWSGLLHNHTSLFIRETLLRSSNIIVATYPYHLDYNDEAD